jgi:hypothetical protein
MDWREQGWKGTHRTTEMLVEETTFAAERTVLTHWLAHYPSVNSEISREEPNQN